ncbi:extracellular beta-galactosidase [Tirmania nivea]|nr:extracellular beta-galactosidase [Tirmania nivea]
MQPGINVRLFCIGYLLLITYALTVQNNPSRLQKNVLFDWSFSTENQYPLLGNGESGEDLNWRGGRLSDNGLSDKVQWDNSTLYIDGQKVFIYSGEFHYWRIPVPDLYLDIFQKLRATGYNAVSIYFHWGFHNPAEGVWDFETGAHDLQPIFNAAKTAGLWIIARPGPYIHAETTAGGLPGWLIQLPQIEVRTNGTKYTEYWKAYIERIGPIIARNQIGSYGTGTVILAQIENEYYWGGGFKYEGADEYMAMLSHAYRSAGILVPIFHNDVGMARSWLPKNYPSILDIYGLDTYPRGFDCDDPLRHFHIRTDYYNYFKRWYPNGPQFTPEFQGGAFDPWGGPGYEKCADMVGTSFVNVYYKNNIAQRFTMMNIYMAFGGTNWGYLLTPVVYTSYDYGAGISEGRLIRDKLNEGKLIALFLRTMDSLLHADLIGNTSGPSGGSQYSSNPAVYITELHNQKSDTRYYIIRHTDTNSLDDQTFDLRIQTASGEEQLRHLLLQRRESKILITSYSAGGHQILYSTVELLTWQTIDGVDTLFYVTDDRDHVQEIAFISEDDEIDVQLRHQGIKSANITVKNNIVTLLFTSEPGHNITSIRVSNTLHVISFNKASAYKFWAPVLREGPGKVNLQDQVLVHGPYLVRNATVDGSVLHLVGDINQDTSLHLWVTARFNKVRWNGKDLHLEEGPFMSRQATLRGPDEAKVILPCLNTTETEWKVMDSLPEIEIEYDDSKWVVARNSSTNEAFPPITLPCLYAGEYGFHTGTVIYRGRFNISQTGIITGVHLEIWGGTAFGYSAWLNGKYVTSQPGNAWSERFVDDWSFAPDQFKEGENVLVILSDSNGYDRDNGVTFFDDHTTKKPRGIKSVILLGTERVEFTSWKLQGNAGGEKYDDAVRAPYNEDGLYAVRVGAHFPGFEDAAISSGSPMEGFPGAGIKFYRTTVNITYPLDYDVPLAFFLEMPQDTQSRVQLFVNGYQMGRYVNHIGPQSVFPVYPGIINRGENVIGLAVWGMHEPDEGKRFQFTRLSLEAMNIFITGYGEVSGEGLITGLPQGRGKHAVRVKDIAQEDQN